MAPSASCIGDACNGGTSGASSSVPFWGGITTSSYKLLLALHILSVIAAFGPTLIYPAITRFAQNNEGVFASRVASLPFNLNRRMFLPALIAAAVFGILLSADSSGAYDMSKPWISAAFAIVIALILDSWFLVRPAQKRLMDGLAAGEDGKDMVRGARASVAAGTGIFHVCLVIVVILMIWKPGQS
jgi:uncharacterized membrane protein